MSPTQKNRRAAFPDKCYYTQNVGILKAVMGRTNADLSPLCYILPLKHLTVVCNHASVSLTLLSFDVISHYDCIAQIKKDQIIFFFLNKTYL